MRSLAPVRQKFYERREGDRNEKEEPCESGEAKSNIESRHSQFLSGYGPLDQRFFWYPTTGNFKQLASICRISSWVQIGAVDSVRNVELMSRIDVSDTLHPVLLPLNGDVSTEVFWQKVFRQTFVGEQGLE